MKSDIVRHAASGQWDTVLQQLCGLTEAETKPGKIGMPCPNCGGTDRYEFKSVDDGYYMCRGCGAGDGWSMIQKRLGCDFSQAVEQVADYLRIGSDRTVLRTITPKPRQPPVEQANRSAIANKASYIWQNAQPADRNHPYLIKKHLPPLKLRQHHDSLVSQVFNQDRQLVNLQFIHPDSSKHFLKNGQTTGCFQWWGSLSWSVYVCEGVADAISTFLNYHRTRLTIAAYSAGNIPAVAKHLRQSLPGHRLVLVLDNDAPTPQRNYRPGISALRAHNYFDDIILPHHGMDASDLWVRGHERRQ